MIEKQFLRRESALWITNKMVFVYAFMLFLVYGCMKLQKKVFQ